MQVTMKSISGSVASYAPVLPARRNVSVRAVAQQEAKPVASAPSGAEASGRVEEIYIGFPKGDYAPRTGRKGRVIVDDPRKYASKEDRGWFLGATGGWAGGEVALKQWAAEAKKEASPASSSKPAAQPAQTAAAEPVPGKEPIYVGFSKDELELRKSGAKGRVIYDDALKYPNKEDLGPLTGATGGFAGGEKGLKSFVEVGEVRLRQPGQPGGRQFSPVAVAGILAAAGAGGGILLTDLFNSGEELVNGELVKSPLLDDNTKTLLLAAMGLVAGVSVVLAVRTALNTLGGKLQESVQSLLLNGVFFLAVFLIARAILEY